MRRALLHSSRRLVLVSAFVACSAPRGSGFLPTARQSTTSARQGIDRRWSSATPPPAGGAPDTSSAESAAASRHYSTRRRRRKRDRVSMAGERGAGAGSAGASERQGPGKGTQVVLLRHGMSTFNKLNIFTVRKTRERRPRMSPEVRFSASKRRNACLFRAPRPPGNSSKIVGILQARGTKPKSGVMRDS